MLHTTKLASPRGMRSFMKNTTRGSSRNAIIAAMITVMKKTRPKYSSAMAAAAARIPTPNWSDFCVDVFWTTTGAVNILCLSL